MGFVELRCQVRAPCYSTCLCVCVCVCFVCVPSPVTCMLRECRWAGEEAREEEEMVVERCCHDVKAGR